MSERRVCRVLGQHRSTQRKVPCGADDEEALTDDIRIDPVELDDAIWLDRDDLARVMSGTRSSIACSSGTSSRRRMRPRTTTMESSTSTGAASW